MARLNKLLVTDEVRRVIAEAIKDRDCVYADHSALRIARSNPHSGITEGEIAELIVQAAIQARVPVEMSKPAVARPRHEPRYFRRA
jgi:hypothetical protein